MYDATVPLDSQIAPIGESSQDQHVLTLKIAPIDDCLPGQQVLHLGCDRGYTSERLIGRGSFGAALLVHNAQGKECVIKAVDLLSLKPKLREDAHLEPEIMKRLKHPYIVRYRESFLEKGMLAIVMDYAGGGDLLQHVEAARQQEVMLPDHQVRTWFVQALLGMQYMHKLSVIHRDLKNENLFLENSDHLRIGDFGLARVLSSPGGALKEEQIVGTPYYWSPEICLNGIYSTASDMWALGCVLYELLSLGVPFDAVDLSSLLVKVSGPAEAPRLPKTCSRCLSDLCASLLIKDFTERPSVQAVLEQPIVQQVMSSLRKHAIDVKQLELNDMLQVATTTRAQSETKDVTSTAEKLTGSTADTCQAPCTVGKELSSLHDSSLSRQQAMQLSAAASVPGGGQEIICCEPQKTNMLKVVNLESAEQLVNTAKPTVHPVPPEVPALLLPASEAVEVVHSTRTRVPSISAQAQRQSFARSLSPDVAYKHQLWLSRSCARAAGAPLHWLREQRQERSDCNLHVQDQTSAEADKPESWAKKLCQIPKLQLGAIKALSELDVLSAAVLPSSDLTSACQQDGAAASHGGAATGRADPKCIVRSKSSSVLSSARVESSREKTNVSRLQCHRKPPIIMPFALGLERIRENPKGGKVHGPAAPRGFPIKVADRSKSFARDSSSKSHLEKQPAPSSARMELPQRATSSQRRYASKEAPLRTALKAGLLLQNVGVALRAPHTASSQEGDAPRSQRGQLQMQVSLSQQMALYGQGLPKVQPLLLQQQPKQRIVGQANPGSARESGALPRNRSEPGELRSARARSKSRNVL